MNFRELRSHMLCGPISRTIIDKNYLKIPKGLHSEGFEAFGQKMLAVPIYNNNRNSRIEQCIPLTASRISGCL